MDQFGVLSLGSRLKRLSDRLFSEVESIYTETGVDINPSHFPILRLLQMSTQLTVVEIAETLGVSHPAISKQVNKLLIEELVIKTADELDNRRFNIKLSSKAYMALKKAEPILAAMKIVLEEEAFNIDSYLLDAFTQYEKRLLSLNFKQQTLLRLAENKKPLEIITWCEKYSDYFGELNTLWLEKHFPNEITEQDYRVLSHPQSEILSKGGQIWFAKHNGNIVGTCALLRTNEQSYEIIKLAVAPKSQGLGIGMRLMLTCIDYARSKFASKITLETSTQLLPARKLYQRLGFTEKEPAGGYSVSRADLYMELAFPKLDTDSNLLS